MKKSLCLPLVTMAALMQPALASPQITLGNGDLTGTYDFTAVGGGSGLITVASTAVTGAAFDLPDIGTYSFGVLAATLAGPEADGAFPTSATQSFAYMASDGDSLSGTVLWSSIKDAAFPDLIGSLSYTASGDDDFIAVWGAAGLAAIDIVVHTAQSTLTSLAIDGSIPGFSAPGIISSGEIIPGMSRIDEPSTIATLIMGLALLGIGAAKRRSHFGSPV